MAHPIEGKIKFTIEIKEFGLAEYALSEYQLDNTMLIEVDDVDTCLFNVVEIHYYSSDYADKYQDLTGNKQLENLIQDRCWCMIVENVLPDYLMLLDLDNSNNDDQD